MLYEDLTLAFRILRDFVGSDLERVRIDSKLTFDALVTFTEEFIPQMSAKLEYYPGERPVFDLFDVENEIQRALDRKVPLKSGGYLIIDQTEAMTTIDVNTGAFVGHRNLEETIFNTILKQLKPLPANSGCVILVASSLLISLTCKAKSTKNECCIAWMWHLLAIKPRRISMVSLHLVWLK